MANTPAPKQTIFYASTITIGDNVSGKRGGKNVQQRPTFLALFRGISNKPGFASNKKMQDPGFFAFVSFALVAFPGVAIFLVQHVQQSNNAIIVYEN